MKKSGQMKNIKVKLILGIILISFVASSCGSSKNEMNNKEAELHVKVEEVIAKNHSRIFSYSGKIEGEVHSIISTRIMGNVIKVYVVPGQKVNKGDILLKISDNDIQAKLSQIKSSQIAYKAAFENAKRDYKRYKILFEKGSATQKELDDVSTHYKMAKAQYESSLEMENEINESLKYTMIKAPYSGVISKKYINVGDLASPGIPLIGLEQTHEFNAVARIPESEISCIEKGDIVEVEVKAINKHIIKGEVIEVNLSAQHTGSQYEVKIRLLPEPSQRSVLRSGMYAKVVLMKGDQSSILVPENAIIYRGQLCGIYTVSQTNTALLRWVRLGKKRGGLVEVISGLTEGEKYIKSYSGKIWDGVSLNITK